MIRRQAYDDGLGLSLPEIAPRARSGREDRQPFDRAQARAPAPVHASGFDGELEPWPAREQDFERASSLQPRQLVSEAEMNAGAEGEMPVRPPREVETFGMLVGRGIEIGRRDHGHDLIAALQRDPLDLDILAHIARF